MEVGFKEVSIITSDEKYSILLFLILIPLTILFLYAWTLGGEKAISLACTSCLGIFIIIMNLILLLWDSNGKEKISNNH